MEHLKFYDKDHEEFYKRMIEENNIQNDPYRKSIFYLIGLTEDTRKHCKEIYEIKGGIKPNVLNEAWQTSTSLKITKLSFNLFNGYCGTKEEMEDRNQASDYAVDEIFCSQEFAPYFYEAIKLRFEMI